MKRSRKATERIALFVPSLQGGGAERVMVNLAIGFHERGVPVDLVTFKAEGPYLASLPPQVRVVHLRARRLFTGLPKLIAYLLREQPTVVLSAMKHANVTVLLAGLFAGGRTPIIVSEHNHASTSLAMHPSVSAFVLRVSMKLLYPRARHVVAVSVGVAEDIQRLLSLPAQHVSVIYNPIVGEEIFVKAEQPVDHPRLFEKAIPVVVAAGRLHAQKDFRTLLLAIREARQKRRIGLMILGEGELREELEAMVSTLGLSDDVELPGFVANPYAYMRCADVFVLSSLVEGLPNVLLEAMACGTQVISTDCPSGPAEILEKGMWGRLVPVGNAKALAKAILETLDGPQRSVRERAKDFSIERSVNAYLQLLLPYHERRVSTRPVV